MNIHRLSMDSYIICMCHNFWTHVWTVHSTYHEHMYTFRIYIVSMDIHGQSSNVLCILLHNSNNCACIRTYGTIIILIELKWINLMTVSALQNKWQKWMIGSWLHTHVRVQTYNIIWREEVNNCSTLIVIECDDLMWNLTSGKYREWSRDTACRNIKYT